MARFDLTDFEWSVIQPLLPNKPRGVPRVDDRRVLNGIFWRLRTGAPWADMFATVRSGNVLLADRAYDSDALRERLAGRGAWGNIRAMPHRIDPSAFSGRLYRQRNAVERFFNKLKHFRAVAARYDKRDDNYLASVKLASVRIWLRSYESVT